MDALTKLAVFNDLAPAENLVRRLEESGVEVSVLDESSQQQWQLWNLAPRAHLHVRVAVESEGRARELMQAWIAQEGGDLGAVRCPECGSFKVEYPQFSRKTLLGALPSALAAAGVIERNYYCEACHFTWPDEAPKAEPELDVLNWPKRKP